MGICLCFVATLKLQQQLMIFAVIEDVQLGPGHTRAVRGLAPDQTLEAGVLCYYINIISFLLYINI